MFDERHAFALRFRTLSERFLLPHGVGLFEEAGRVVVAAYERGYLNLPRLAPLIERVHNQPSRAEAEKAGLLPAESYVFLELAGYDTWPCMLHADGLSDAGPFPKNDEELRPCELPDDAEVKVRSINIMGDAIGGLMPSVLNNSPALPRPRAQQGKVSRLENVAELCAWTCRYLADEVECSSGGGNEPDGGEESSQKQLPADKDGTPFVGETDHWYFGPGEVRFDSIEIPVTGVQRNLLKRLVEARRLLLRKDLLEAGWPDDAEHVGDGALRKHLTELRTVLRTSLKLRKNTNPIPCKGRGQDAAWKLDIPENRPEVTQT